MSTWDVVVVGARCAGSPTAMLYARAGARVLMLDKVAFPRDTLSTLYIQQPGIACLARWGVLDDVVATGCPPVREIAYQVGDVRLTGAPEPVDGADAAYAPRRIAMDAVLARAAVAAGVEFRERATVTGLEFDGDRVTGVRLADGSVERARLVVGADGMRSAVAGYAGAATIVEHPPRTCVYYTYWPELSARFEVYEGLNQWVGVMPTTGATGVAVYFPQSRFDEVRRDAKARYLAGIRALAPDLAARLDRPVDRLYGTGDQRNFFRVAAGPGWALVGDSAHHLDSITARGITNAFRSADLLTGLTAPHLDDEPRLRAALSAYAEENHRSMLDAYQHTLWVSRMKPPAHHVRMLTDVAADPAMVTRFLSVIAGTGSGRELRSLAVRREP